MKKFLLFTLLTILFAVPLSSHAVATLPFYKVCTDNDQCISDDCETTTELNKSYCDCDDNADCSTEYGTGTWECKNGTTESYQLDYCVDTTTGNDQLDKLDETLEQTGLKIGEKCSSDTDCITNQCEDSDIDIDPDNYCVCDTAQHCAATYGGLAVDWTCKNGITSSHALNYCEKTDGTSILPISTENIISAVEAQENQAKLHGGRTIDFAPPKLSVLGDVCKLTNVTFKEGETSSVPWIGQCVSGIFSYMLIIGTMLAVLFIVIGGIIYIASAGNSQKAGTGKDFITKSIFGLIILLCSYLLLNTVNPELTQLNSIGISVLNVPKIDNINETVGVPQPYTGPLNHLPSNVPSYKQFDSKWGSSIYGYNTIKCDCKADEAECNKVSTKCCTTIAQAGCGPTSLAMILSSYGNNITPDKVSAFAGIKGNGRICNTGTDINTTISKLNKSPWMAFEGEKITKTEALGYLKDKKPVIILCKGCSGTGDKGIKKYNGHYMVLKAINNVGMIEVNDPGANSTKAIRVMTQDQINQNGGFWYVHPK